MSATANRVIDGRGVISADLIGASIALAFLLVTALPYFMLSLGGEYIAGDARQQVWTIWTLLEPAWFPPDLFSSYMIDKTMPDAFVWIVAHLARTAGGPELVFAWIGVLSLLASAILAWLCARATGGAAASWAAFILVFAVDTVADRTAGGLPRALGMPITFMAVYGLVSLRPAWTAAASVLGGLFWYPAGVIAGSLFFVQMFAPAAWFGQVQGRSWIVRASVVALVGVATALPVLPDMLAPSPYGKLIAAGDPAWPEAGNGGRFIQDHMMGAVSAVQPAHILIGRAAGTLSSRTGSWWPHTTQWARVSRAFGLAFFAGIVVTLMLCARADAVARRLLVVFVAGLVLYLAAFAVAPLMYIPERYLSYLWMAFGIVAAPYAAIVLLSRMPPALARRLPQAAAVALTTAAIVALPAGRPTTQGLGVHPAASERDVLRFLARTPSGALIAGWPGGMIDDVPYFAHRPVLLSREMHFPWHDVYAREMRERTQAIIAAWYSADAGDLEALQRRYGVQYFVVDKTLLRGSASYFAPFDRTIEAAQEALQGRQPYVAAPDPGSIAYENGDYLVLALAAGA